VTVSMRVMSAGDGYKYLLRTVAAGDGDRSVTDTPWQPAGSYARSAKLPTCWLTVRLGPVDVLQFLVGPRCHSAVLRKGAQ
jgi:hypothetical protein